MEFSADGIGGDLCHQTVGHQFTAGNRDEAGESVAGLMVKTDDAAGDVAARGIVVGTHEGSDTGIGPQNAGGREGRGHLGTFRDEQRHLVRRHGNMVAFFEGDARRGCADNAHRVAGDQDVCIRRFAAAVDYHIVHAVRKDQQRPFSRIHTYVDTRHLRNGMAPDAAGIHRDRSIVISLFTRNKVAGVDAADRVAFADESGDFRVQADLPPVELGIQHVGCAKPERVHASVRNTDRADQIRIDRRLQPPRKVGIDDIRPDSRFAARFNEGLLVAQVIFGKGNEQTVRLFHAVGSDATQDLVFFDAFFGRFGIVDSIAGT